MENGGHADGSLERRFQSYLRPDLLVLDDFGLKPLHPPATWCPKTSKWTALLPETGYR